MTAKRKATPEKKTAKKTKLDKLNLTDGKGKASTETEGNTPSTLDNLDLADGKEAERVQEAKDLEKLLGIDVVNPFGTTLPEVFEENMKESTLLDLQRLAEKAGVFAVANKTSLKERLRNAFKDFQRGESIESSYPNRQVEVGDPNNPDLLEALKLMKQGL